MKRLINRNWHFLVLVAILLFSAACASTHQGREVEPSGFLGDYSQLREGESGEALLTYVDPSADFKRYNAILMEPIRAYVAEDSALHNLAPEDLQKLLDYFDASIRERLGGDYTFVTKPGPNAMRFRVALTDATGAKMAIDLVSSVMPPGIALSTLKSMATGRGAGLGATNVEFEALDSMTGRRLAAGVDRRVGNKYTLRFDKFSKWRATKSACDYWAQRIHERLNELRGASSPAAP